MFDSALHTPDRAAGYGEANRNGYSNPASDRIIENASDTGGLPIIPLHVANDLYAEGTDVEWQPRLGGRVLAKDVLRRP